MAFSVEGKTVIVTGAANGVGLAIARRFAALDARVMLAGASDALLEEEAEILTKSGLSAQFFSADLREKLAMTNLISATVDAFDRIDILVNAARDVAPTDPFDQEDHTLEDLFSQNVLTTFRLSQLVAKRMIRMAEDDPDRAEIGAIVNVGSIAARRTLPELMGYSVASAALDQLTRSMAAAFAQHRIRVNAIAIGSVMSASLKAALKDRAGLQDELTAVTPLGRIGEAEEAAEAAIFLASDSSSFITGQILAVDGGRTMLDPMDRPAH